jgi:hypothetical protein
MNMNKEKKFKKSLNMNIENLMTQVDKLEEHKQILVDCREICRRAGDMHTVKSYDLRIEAIDSKIVDILVEIEKNEKG